MSRFLSLEKIVEKIYNKHGNSISLLSYGGNVADNKSKFFCNVCETIWETTVHAVTKKGRNGCPKCGRKNPINKLNVEMVKDILIKDGCEFLDSEYINSKTPFAIKFKCGHIGKVSLDAFKNGTRCAKCSKKKMGLSQRISQEKIDEILLNNELVFIEFPSGYINRDSKIKFVCKYGHVEEHKISVFLRNTGCSKCRKIRVSLENSGENGSNWKGGISSIISFMKKQITQWKKDSIKNSNYSCIICGDGHRFNDVHHLYGFNNILNESLLELGFERKLLVQEYSDDELFLLTNLILKKHYEHPLGVALCRKHHKDFHKEFGLTNFTPENFYEFKQRIQSGNIIINQGEINVN